MIKEKRPEGCLDIGRFRLLNNLREQYGALVISCYSATSRHKNCVLGWKVCTGRDDSRSTVIKHTRELENNVSLLICFRFFLGFNILDLSRSCEEECLCECKQQSESYSMLPYIT